jgi:hypothetical protein
MGGIVGAVLGSGGGSLLDGISKVINSIRGKSPEDAAKLEQIKAQYQTEFMQAQADLQKAQISANTDLNNVAGQNIRAEAQSGSWFTRDARPAVIWVGLFMISWNYIVVPLIGLHFKLTPVTFPDMFWQVWCIVCTGYVFARSADKLFGGAGGSAQLPFNIKLDSKGDK